MTGRMIILQYLFYMSKYSNFHENLREAVNLVISKSRIKQNMYLRKETVILKEVLLGFHIDL